jgi:hypothetical protein
MSASAAKGRMPLDSVRIWPLVQAFASALAGSRLIESRGNWRWRSAPRYRATILRAGETTAWSASWERLV